MVLLMQHGEACPIHGKKPRPNLCDHCARHRPTSIPFDELEGTLKRVIETCSETGRQKVSFKVVGDLKIKNDPNRPWRYSS